MSAKWFHFHTEFPNPRVWQLGIRPLNRLLRWPWLQIIWFHYLWNSSPMLTLSLKHTSRSYTFLLLRLVGLNFNLNFIYIFSKTLRTLRRNGWEKSTVHFFLVPSRFQPASKWNTFFLVQLHTKKEFLCLSSWFLPQTHTLVTKATDYFTRL